MNKKIDLKEMMPLIKEQIDAGKSVSFMPRGDSMRPMLIGGEDMIILKKPEGRLHLNDVALYYRRETDKYSVHRVAGFRKDGTYVMLGDNNIVREYGISDEDVVGVVTHFYHKGRMRSVNDFTYGVYREFWWYSRPVRHFWRRSKIALSKKLKG